MYASGGEVWDATLIHAYVRFNMNRYATQTTSQKPYCRLNVHCRRFYVLQVLHPIGDYSTCVLFTRWGRVGERGFSQQRARLSFVAAGTTSYDYFLQGPFEPTIAISEFKKRFRHRTGMKWENRISAVSAKSCESEKVA